MEVEKLGKASKTSPKGLQMTCGENFVEMWGFNNLEVAPGGSERSAEAEVNAVHSRDSIKVKGYTVYINRNPQEKNHHAGSPLINL